MGIVFINYRRAETAGEARALYQDLVQLLGPTRVFMDVDDIALGRDFRQVLTERLEGCEVMLSLIGHEWLDSRDETGQRRLDNPADFVRIEIATALKRNVAVTPVLLQGARMPAAESLPDELRDLAFRNGAEISHARWESDVQDLVRRLGLKGATVAPRRTGLWVGVAAVALLALGAGGWFLTQRPESAPAPLPAPQPSPAPSPVQMPAPVPPASPVPAPVPTPAPASTAEIQALFDQLSDNRDQARAAALETLRRDYIRSPVALGLAVNQLAVFGKMTRGRLELLNYLNDSDDAAWTPDRRSEAAEAVRRIRAAIDSGKFKPTQPVREELDRLRRRVGA